LVNLIGTHVLISCWFIGVEYWFDARAAEISFDQ
jgi:hypothetical protein